MGKGRYFIAIVLTGEALGKAEEIKRELRDRFGLRGALRSPAHITLHRPFEWDETKEQVLINTLDQFKLQKTFPVKIEGAGGFSQRVVYLAVEPDERLTALHTALRSFAVKKLALFNEAEDERGFHPHVTVAFRDLRKRQFNEVLEFVSSVNFSQTIEVRGISLLKLEDVWRELRFLEV